MASMRHMISYSNSYFAGSYNLSSFDIHIPALIMAYYYVDCLKTSHVNG